jgi:hypothetical protein
MYKNTPDQNRAPYPLFKPDPAYPLINFDAIEFMKARGHVPNAHKITPQFNLISVTWEFMEHIENRVLLNPEEDALKILDPSDLRVIGWGNDVSIGHVGYKRSKQGQTTFEVPYKFPIVSWNGITIETKKHLYPGVIDRARFNWIMNQFAWQRGGLR